MRQIKEVLTEAARDSYEVFPSENLFANYPEGAEITQSGYEQVRFIEVHTRLAPNYILNCLSKASLLARADAVGLVEGAETPQLRLLAVMDRGHLLFEDLAEPQTI